MRDCPPPRRRYVATIKIEADTERDLISHLHNIGHNWEREGISKSSVSGGYGSGHIIEVDCDENITHETWAEALEQYLAERKRPCP